MSLLFETPSLKHQLTCPKCGGHAFIFRATVDIWIYGYPDGVGEEVGGNETIDLNLQKFNIVACVSVPDPDVGTACDWSGPMLTLLQEPKQ